MRNFLVAAFAALFIVGCASDGPEAQDTQDPAYQIRHLQNQVNELERRLRIEQERVNEINRSSERASHDAGAARSLAEQAMGAAQIANEKVDRMTTTCCALK